MYHKPGGFKMPGFSASTIKKNPALLPLYACVITGGTIATLYLIRLAVASPEVTWQNKTNSEPWERYRNKDYKFYKHPSMPEAGPSPAPKY